MRLWRIGGWMLAVFNRGCSREDEDLVAQSMSRVYERVGGEGYVEVYLYPSRSLMESSLLMEARERGVAVDAFFPVMHEAWTGIPRIHVVPGEVKKLGKAGEAFLVHEAFHSVLHGSLEYYIVPLPQGGEGLVAAYLAATSLKDLEVHAEMYRHGFIDELVAEKKYWEENLGSRWLCGSLDELGDVLRALTIWLVLGEEPPLDASCRRAVGGVVELYRGMLGGVERPWRRLMEAVDAVREAVNSLAVSIRSPSPLTGAEGSE